MDVELAGKCAGNGREVARRVDEIFAIVTTAQTLAEWPGDEAVAAQLPAWLVGGCAPEQTPAEVTRSLARWRTMSPEEKATDARTEAWTLRDLLHWMHPDECPWRSPRVVQASNDLVRVILEVDGWPVAHGAVDWILRVAGAYDVGSAL
jgi:hypothetical protein